MIRPINIAVNAAHPTLPLLEVSSFVGSPSAVFIRGIPAAVGAWSITAVRVAATYPDNSQQTVSAVASPSGSAWIATLPAPSISGRVEGGFQILADGTDEHGDAVTGYCLAVADLAVVTRDITPEPGGQSWVLHYFAEVPSVLRTGDCATVDGSLSIYTGAAWVAFDAAAMAALSDHANNTAIHTTATEKAVWNAKQNALSAAQLAAIAAVPNKADKSELPYALAAAEKANGAYALADRTVSYHTLDTEPGIDFSGTPSIGGYIRQDGQGAFPITSAEVIDFNELRCIIKANYDGGYAYAEAPPSGSSPRAFEVSVTDEYMQVVAEWDVTRDSNSPFTSSGTAYPSMSSVELPCSNGMNVFIPLKWSEATVPLSFPASTSGKSRDFYFALNVPSSATAPTVTAPADVTLLNEFGAAFSFAAAEGWNVWHFTEVAANTFRVESCGGASAIKAALDGKQATLTSAQLAAANSGITAAAVAMFYGYAAAIAGKSAPYPFRSVETVIGDVTFPPSAYPITFTTAIDITGDIPAGTEITIAEGDTIGMISESPLEPGMLVWFAPSSAYDGVCTFDATTLKYNATSSEVTDLKFNGVAPVTNTSPVLVRPITLTLAPFANNTFTPADASPLVIGSVSVSPVANTMRDLWFVVDCSAISAAALPSIEWPAAFEPTNDDTDNLALEAGKVCVFMLSEFAPGRFMVARQVFAGATQGGN